MLVKLRSLIEIIMTVKNWFSVLLLYMGLRKNIVLVFRNGIKFEIRDNSHLDKIYELIKIQLCSPILEVDNDAYKTVLGNMEVAFKLTDEDSIYRTYMLSRLYKELNMNLCPTQDSCEFYFEGKKFLFYFDLNDDTWIHVLHSTFIAEAYSALNVRGKIVADIGASYGDTALYFAFKGAKEVYAYEPNPWVAEILKKNVRLNNLSNVIKVYPYAVSCNKGEAILTVPKNTRMSGSLYYNDIFKFNNKVEVDYVAVQKVTPPRDAEVAKIDCEGGEYDIILRWLNNRIYNEIILEFHGDFRQLLKQLRGLGYKVKILKFFHDKKFGFLGLLYAYAEKQKQ